MQKQFEAIMVESEIRKSFNEMRDKLKITSSELLRCLMEKKTLQALKDEKV